METIHENIELETNVNTENEVLDNNSQGRIIIRSRTQDSRNREGSLSFYVNQMEQMILSSFNGLKKFSDKEEEQAKEIERLQGCLKKSNDQIANFQEEFNTTKNILDEKVNENQRLILKLSNMELAHKNELEAIAINSRESSLARKVVDKWKSKVLFSQKTKKLVKENQLLKKELLKCQREAAKALLRSANELNTEALSMSIYPAYTKRLNFIDLIDQSKDSLDSSLQSINSDTIQSDISFSSSSSAVEKPNNKENVHKFKTYGKFVSTAKQKEFTDAVKHIRKTALPRRSCDMNHMHVCYCPPKQRPKSSKKNVAFASLAKNEKASVLYNPTGTAVVIEKHPKA